MAIANLLGAMTEAPAGRTTTHPGDDGHVGERHMAAGFQVRTRFSPSSGTMMAFGNRGHRGLRDGEVLLSPEPGGGAAALALP